MSNTITAYFKGRVGVAESVYQNDYGMVMNFDSIDLPAHFDCYFSILNQEEAIPGIGADRMVAIPNSVLANPGTVTIHIPLHTSDNDSEVEYVVYFKVIGRARPIDDGTPAQMTAIQKALALLQNPITNIEQIVNEALAFTGDTFDEMQAQLDADQAAYESSMNSRATSFESGINSRQSQVESDFANLNAQYQTALAAHTVDSEVQNVRVGDDNVTYATAGEATRKQFSKVKHLISSINEHTGIRNVIVEVLNGTQANPGNATCVHTVEIPVQYGDIIELKTNRPLDSGVTYNSCVTLLRSDKSYYTETDWVGGIPPYVVVNAPVSYVVFSIRCSDGTALRKTSFDNFIVYAEIKSGESIDDLFNAEANSVPKLRNGSMGNPGNTSKIALVGDVPVNEARSMQLTYLGSVNDDDVITWDVVFKDANGNTVRNPELSGTCVNVTGWLNDFQTVQSLSFDIIRSDSGGSAIPLRIDDVGNCVRVEYFNDLFLNRVYGWLKPQLHREVFAYALNAGKVVFRDRPIFSLSGRCAWRLEGGIGFKTGNSPSVNIPFSTILTACGSSDSVTENGVTWVYLRTNRGIVYNDVTGTVSIKDLSGTEVLSGDEYLLIGVWSGSFVGGLMYEKFIRDSVAPPASSFNSNNILYDIDVADKVQEFANCIGSNTDAEAFLFFTDPHTYKKNMDMNDVEYLQTVIQKYYNSIPANFVLCGGDWLTDGDTPQMAKYKLGLEGKSMEAMVRPYYQMVGNHDTNYQGTQILDSRVLTNLWFRRLGKNYYSFDGANTKFYVFDSQLDGVSSMDDYMWEQIDWFAKALESDSSDHIAIGIHIWRDQGVETPMATNLRTVITGYNNRYVMQLNEVEYDFTTVTGHIEFVLAGHIHVDFNDVVDESVPVIITTNAWRNNTVCFDLVFADYTARTIDCIRVGEGSNRKFSLDTGEPITN